LSPEYARVNSFNQGQAVVDVDADGQFHVSNLRLNADYVVRTG
jgi:hypothetical protein